MKILKVLEHTLAFDEAGTANGDELSEAEKTRLRQFHFVVEETPNMQPEKPRESVFDAHVEPPGDDPVIVLPPDEDEVVEEAAQALGIRDAASRSTRLKSGSPRRNSARKERV